MELLKDKVIWITGASSGIGEALAYQLSAKGNTLILSARNRKRLELVQSNCHSPERVKILTLDLADTSNMDALVSEAMEFFGSIDVLINNAGLSQRSLIIETQFSVYERLIQINYLGTLALSKAILPYFIQEKNGYFVVVSSLMGKFGSPYRSGYCGAKHALHGFFDVLRMEHEKDNIQVTMICPGFVQTEVARNALTADGSPQETNDTGTANGLPVALFVKKMIKALERKKFEAYIGGEEVKGVYLKRLFPKMLHKLVLRSKVR